MHYTHAGRETYIKTQIKQGLASQRNGAPITRALT